MDRNRHIKNNSTADIVNGALDKMTASGGCSSDGFDMAWDGMDKIQIAPSLKKDCPIADCIVKNMMNSGPLSTTLINGLLKPCVGETKTDIIFLSSAFVSPGKDPNAVAASEILLHNNSKMFIYINKLKCASSNKVDLFESVQHELIHADINRRLVEKYGFTTSGSTMLDYQSAFDALMLEEYGESPSQVQHELMLNYYIDDMVQSLIDMNGGHGTYNDFVGLVLNGFPEPILINACSRKTIFPACHYSCQARMDAWYGSRDRF
ncbi:MAG: hypothetical protein V3V14_04385 [Saprospiraceae bacterium]